MSFFLSFIAPLVLLVCVSGLTEEQVVDVSIRLFPDILKSEGRAGQTWIPKYWTLESGEGSVNGLAILAEIPFQPLLTTLTVHTDYIYGRDGILVPVTSHLMYQILTITGLHEIVPPVGWTKFEQDWRTRIEEGKVDEDDEEPSVEKDGDPGFTTKTESSLVVVACILLFAWA